MAVIKLFWHLDFNRMQKLELLPQGCFWETLNEDSLKQKRMKIRIPAPDPDPEV